MRINILITGCAGFIGYNLCNSLIDESLNIFGIDNFSGNYGFYNRKEEIKSLLEYEHFTFFDLDLLDFEKLEKIFQLNTFDAIIHLSGKTGIRDSVFTPFLYVDNNIKVTNYLLELCRKYDIKQFIFASSSSVYGNVKGVLKEDFSCNPVSPYAASKRSCEIYGETYSSLYSINFTALRFFTTYGPFQRPNLAIANFVNSLYNNRKLVINGDGTKKRDFVYITDVIQGIKKTLKKNFRFQIINIGSGNSISISSLIKKIELYCGKKAKIEYQEEFKADVSETLADLTKAKELLGYTPKVSIDEGLQKYINWYNQITKRV